MIGCIQKVLADPELIIRGTPPIMRLVQFHMWVRSRNSAGLVRRYRGVRSPVHGVMIVRGTPPIMQLLQFHMWVHSHESAGLVRHNRGVRSLPRLIIIIIIIVYLAICGIYEGGAMSNRQRKLGTGCRRPVTGPSQKRGAEAVSTPFVATHNGMAMGIY